MHKLEIMRGLLKRRIDELQELIEHKPLDYEQKRFVEEITLIEKILDDINDGKLYSIEGDKL